MALLPNFFGSALALLVGLILLFVQGVSLDPAPVATCLMVLAFAAVGGGALGTFRRDPYRSIRFSIAASVLVTILGSAIIASTDGTRIATTSVTLGSFGIAVALIVYRVRATYVSDAIPNILLTRTSRDEIRESNGVQWFGMQSTETFDSATTVEVIFQNCVDAARTVRLRLIENGTPLRDAKKVSFPEHVGAVLTASEVARVVVPIRALPRVSGAVELTIYVEASGAPGQRTRRFRAKEAGSSLAEWLQSIPFLRGRWLRSASGSHFRYRIRSWTGANPSSLPPMSERWERLWTVARGASTRPAPADLANSDGSMPNLASMTPSKPFTGSSRPAAPGSNRASGRPLQTDSVTARPVASPSLSPGARVRVRRGNSIHPAKILHVDPMRVQCELDDGQQVWVMPSQIDI